MGDLPFLLGDCCKKDEFSLVGDDPKGILCIGVVL